MMNGKLIAFIGMDGAGKSTVLGLLKKRLEKQGFKVKTIYSGRGRGNLLPIQFFGRVYRKAGGKESNVPVKGRKFEKISLIHTLSAPIFTLDLILRYFFIIKPMLKRYDYVLTDRYSTDILLMNKVLWKFKLMLSRLIPKPNKIFYIYNNIKILYKRKPDHSIEDLRRQEKLFSKILTFIKTIKIKNNNLDLSIAKILRNLP